tara:strand:- start:708 stop:2078 length:1371 start_codon:yes stop_codon:yes gene_type:complete
MSLIKSRPFLINNESISFDNLGGKLIGINKKNAKGLFEPVDNSSVEFSTFKNSEQSLDAFRKAVYGPNKDLYPASIEVASDEELTTYFAESQKKFNNEQFVTNDFEKPKSLAYSTGRGRDDYDQGDIARNFLGGAKSVHGPLMKSDSEILAYPLDIDPNQDHFKISRYDYRRATVNQSKSARKVGETNVAGDSVKGSKLMGSILLPMPKATDVNGVEWGKSELTQTGLLALGAAEKSLSALDAMLPGNPSGKSAEDKALDRQARRNAGRNAGQGFFESLKGLGQAKTVQSVTDIVGGALGGQIDADTVLARRGGAVLNPNAEMLFQGPVIRDFAFSFVMIARSEKEGKEIRKIIHFLKKGMAPKFRNTTFLSSPDIFILEYKNGPRAKDHLKTVNRFNPGGLALTTMNVDYAPNGYWSAYTDSQPVALKMDLNFTELRPIYEGDQTLSELEGTVGY